MKEELIEFVKSLIDKSVDLVDREDEEALVGRMIMLSQLTQHDDTVLDASLELSILSRIIDSVNK